MAQRRWFEGTFTSLRHRNVRVFFAGQVTSDIGTWFQQLAIPWVILSQTHSSTAVGVSYALQFLPTVVLGAYGGLVADRYNKRTIMFLCAIAGGLLASTMGVVLLTSDVPLWALFLFSLLGGCIRMFEVPARRGFIGEMVSREDLSNALSLNFAERNLSRILGPMLGGVVIAVFGVGWCFMINGLSYIGVVVTIRMLQRTDLGPMPSVGRDKGQLREGLRYAWSVPIVRTALTMGALVGVLTLQINQVVVPVFVREGLHAGAWSVGVVMSLGGLGAIVGSLWAAARAKPSVSAMAAASTVMALSAALCAAAPNVWTLAISTLPYSAGVMVLVAYSSSACQLSVPPTMQGRVSALNNIALIGTAPLGGLIVGTVMAVFGPRAGLVQGAIGAAVATAVAIPTVMKLRSHGPVTRVDAVTAPADAR